MTRSLRPYACWGGICESDLPGEKVWSEVVCSLHRWRFKLQDGWCTTMRGNAVRQSLTEVREGQIWVCVERRRSRPVEMR
jgi:nitrite reductase/ring-hydroxylating ferredoxin subunit